MTSLSPNCELEEGEISDDPEELGDYDARTALVPRPPAKPFGIETSSSSSRTTPPHPHKCRHRVNNSTPRYYKKPLSVFNPPGGHYDRNSGGHSRPPIGGGLRSAVLCRPPPPSRGCASLPSFVTSHDSSGRTSGDDRCGGRRSTSHLDHYSWFRRPSSSSGHSSRDHLESSTTSSSSSHGRFQTPSSQRSRPERSPPPPASHSGSARKNQSQPKFLQNSVVMTHRTRICLAQYKSIQHQLEDLNKSSLSEDSQGKCSVEKGRASPTAVSIPVICDGNIECRSLPVSPCPPTPPAPLPQASDISDDEETDLMELRRKALETLRSTKPPSEVQEAKNEAPPDESDNASVLPLEVLPSDLLETERPIQEVQEKQQLKKGHRHPWYDRELTQQMRRKDRAYHKWKRHPCYDNWEAFKAIKRVYLRMLKRKRAAYAQANGGEEDSAAKGAAEAAGAGFLAAH
ncbi:hypothetical protein HPB52_008085 [Rhipicephalus sanguineus]|uniref:Uncharacterized protein n=1 Tax=Rhipicephalus sanguineus TaxID=34632 RepID=A0A9D4PEZ7_RHISA|nr:hypothetical protein HPB52_008085 [Rhipicephalus sanguineus]